MRIAESGGRRGGQIEGHVLPSSVVARAPVSNENVCARSEKEGWQGKVQKENIRVVAT